MGAEPPQFIPLYQTSDDETLLPLYGITWAGSQTMLMLVLRQMDSLPTALLHRSLDGILWGLAHLLCLRVLQRRNLGTVRKRSLLLGVALWLAGCTYSISKNVLFPFELIDKIPLVLPFLAAGYVVAHAQEKRRRPDYPAPDPALHP